MDTLRFVPFGNNTRPDCICQTTSYMHKQTLSAQTTNFDQQPKHVEEKEYSHNKLHTRTKRLNHIVGKLKGNLCNFLDPFAHCSFLFQVSFCLHLVLYGWVSRIAGGALGLYIEQDTVLFDGFQHPSHTMATLH